MTADPRASALVLTHNRAGELARTITHLRDLPERPAILVVDNASGDGSREMVIQRFPDVRLLGLPENIGAAARNVGLRELTSPYVALVDDDSWWAPGALRRAADLLDAHPRLAVVSGRVLVGADERPDPACARMARSPLPPRPDIPGAAILGFLAGASMVRRRAILEAGGFEPRFFLGGEEELLAIDLRTAGWDLAYVDEVVIHHHPSPRRDRAGRRRLLVRNAVWVAWLRRRPGSAARATLGVLRRSPRDPYAILGALDALVGWGWIRRHRRVVPEEVEAALAMLEAAERRRDDAGRLATAGGCAKGGQSLRIWRFRKATRDRAS